MLKIAYCLMLYDLTVSAVMAQTGYTYTKCLQVGTTSYNKNMFLKSDCISAIDCAIMCIEVAKCTAFTYDDLTKTCRLNQKIDTINCELNKENGGITFTKETECPADWKRFRNSCYLYESTTPRTWDNAIEYCVSQRGYLAEVTDEEELQFVNSMINGNVRLGCTLYDGNYQWRTSGQRLPLNDTMWAPNEPRGQECIQIWEYAEKFDDTSCIRLLDIVCEKKKKKSNMQLFTPTEVLGLHFTIHTLLINKSLVCSGQEGKEHVAIHFMTFQNLQKEVAKGVNFIQSREIWVKFNLNVSVGSGICRRCIEKHKDEVQIATDLKGELREICCFLDNSTEREEAGIVTDENLSEIATMNDINQVAMSIDSEAINTESINTDPDIFSSQTTVGSNWSKDERSQKDAFNWAMEMMSHGATQYKIIKACVASQLKSLHGLDNYISDGMESIDTLKKVVSNLGTKVSDLI
ncbi:unnamed protein product [Mytilus edulis]|uniref:Uncharacterized protein n=1 Tax=Mytilus edulis TaxID=6550 RepID=A0A8S3VF57_MYTED|nr:unnamed protein product [Mytilus edulis]